jgi:hypothetical protein
LFEGDLTIRRTVSAVTGFFVLAQNRRRAISRVVGREPDGSLRIPWHLRFCLTCPARGERMRHPTPTLAIRFGTASAEEILDDAA